MYNKLQAIYCQKILSNVSLKRGKNLAPKGGSIRFFETFYQYFVTGFNMFQLLKFVLPWHGVTQYLMFVALFHPSYGASFLEFFSNFFFSNTRLNVARSQTLDGNFPPSHPLDLVGGMEIPIEHLGSSYDPLSWCRCAKMLLIFNFSLFLFNFIELSF